MTATVIGVDEVGLGAWAGPFVVCAFMAPNEAWHMEGLNDSKKLTKHDRAKIARELTERFQGGYVLVTVEAEEIDEMGVERSLSKAMETAILDLIYLAGVPNRVIVDGASKGFLGAEYYPKADGTFPCVMAASVIAKDFRDRLMVCMARRYPEYGFDRHVGYGTPLHLATLQRHGVCALHRRSYRPIKAILEASGSVFTSTASEDLCRYILG